MKAKVLDFKKTRFGKNIPREPQMPDVTIL